MGDNVAVPLRQSLCKVIRSLHEQPITQDTKRELYRVLLISKEQGWGWAMRDVYGGGKDITIYDGLDVIATVYLATHMKEARMDAHFMEEYLRPDFVPTKLAPYNEELDAELRNEEALYQYELPRPWFDIDMNTPKRQWEAEN